MDEVEEVKSKTDIVGVISEYVEIKKAGRNYKGLCPFHGEKTPSFMVSPELQIYKCFGCQAGGDVFEFLMRIEGMEFGEALRTLAKKAGIILKERMTDTPSGRQKERLYQINHLAKEFYHFLLTEHKIGKAALEYVLGRGITKESIDLFGLGFSPNMWDGLQQFMVTKKKAQLEELEGAGLTIRRQTARTEERGYYDRFRGRLMFPLLDPRGNTVGFSGRVIPGVTLVDKDDEGPKYVNTPETEVYHKRAILYGLDVTRAEIKKADQVVVVEGEIDLISSYQARIANVVAIKGSALTDEHVRLLRRISSEMVVALDADLAGDAAARRGIELADGAGFSIRVVKLKTGKDPDECAQKSPEMWRASVEGAVPVYEFLMESAEKRFGTVTAEGKRRIGRELIPIWAKIADPIMRASLIHTLADRLGVGEAVILQEVEKQRVGQVVQMQTLATEGIKVDKSRRDRLEEYLLALGLQKDNQVLLEKGVGKLIKGQAAKRLLEAMARAEQPVEAEKLAGLIPEEMKMFFGEVMLVDVSEVIGDEARWKKEVEKVKRDLEELDLKEEKGRIQREMEGLENRGEEKKLMDLTEDFRRVTAALTRLEKKV